MVPLLLGAIALFVLLGGMRAFQRASITTVKAYGAWALALGGVLLALMLILTGRSGIAISALLLFGPVIYQQWQASRGERPVGGPRAPLARGGMTREEAYEVLGLRPGASAEQVREAHLRLMRAAHPDAGGSDWLASRVNQARDVLLG